VPWLSALPRGSRAARTWFGVPLGPPLYHGKTNGGNEVTETPDEQTGKAEKPQGTLEGDEQAENPGEQTEQTDEATRLAQERVDAGQVGTIKADQEQGE
jgi:hypothetical protein